MYEGTTNSLRCSRCKERFDADPGHFLRGGPDGCDLALEDGHGHEAMPIRVGPRL